MLIPKVKNEIQQQKRQLLCEIILWQSKKLEKNYKTNSHVDLIFNSDDEYPGIQKLDMCT